MTARVAILGLGSIGMRHARNLLAAGVRVTGFDPAPALRSALGQQGGGVAESAAGALDGVDAVVIATPSGAHLDDLAAAVNAGKHVFIEKPLAHTTEGVNEILTRAEDKGLVVCAALNMRFHPAVKAAKALLEKNSLGDILWGRLLAASYLPDWRPHQDYRQGYAADPKTGGALFDFIHEFDLAVHLLGPAKTHAAAARSTGLLDMACEDCADVVLVHEGGVQSVLHVDYVTRPRQRVIEIAGGGGLMRLDLEANTLVALDKTGETLEDQSFAMDSNRMYVDEIDNFLACIAEGATPSCSGRDAFRIVRLVIDARRLAGLPAG